MKKTVLKKKLVLDRETISPLNDVALENVHGGATPAIVSFIVTMLSCGFFCNPQKAR